MKSKLPILAVDFDGVIHDHKNPIEGRRMGPPMEGALEAIKELIHDYRIVIFSAAAENPRHIIDWCEFWKIPFDDVTNKKPNAVAYIDDKGIRFTNWPEVAKLLAVHKEQVQN